MLTFVEQSRLRLSKTTDTQKKSKLGQYFTPANIAKFMADMYAPSHFAHCRLLDAGAGIGSLSAAFLEKWISGRFDFDSLSLDAFEIDGALINCLNRTLKRYREDKQYDYEIHNKDFIETAVDSLRGNLFEKPLPRYTHAILNPPYKKIPSKSAHRYALNQLGIRTVNLYSAFVALSLALLNKNGQLVAIIPRSFCNGPYYLPFRKFILSHGAIRRIHLFDSRTKAFKDDNVLQENIIILIERDAEQTDVEISTSTDDQFSDLQKTIHPFQAIVLPDDSHQFIHVPSSPNKMYQIPNTIRYSLDEIGVTVSTGPVVDFRLKEFLHENPVEDTVPLLYPGHFTGGTIEWPKPGFKKPNAIGLNNNTKRWLYPNGYYCIVRRFSSKEEKRRIVANVVRPENFPDVSKIGFENHLNVFHISKQGLPESLAYGLAAFLNTTIADQAFRSFNGHTQVNATDLRGMKYPCKDDLMILGEWVIRNVEQPQESIDRQLERIMA